MSEDEVEATLTAVVRLPVLAPNAVRSAEVHARCRAIVARRAGTIRPAAAPRPPDRPILTTAFVGALCLVYLVGVVYNAIQVYVLPGA